MIHLTIWQVEIIKEDWSEYNEQPVVTTDDLFFDKKEDAIKCAETLINDLTQEYGDEFHFDIYDEFDGVKFAASITGTHDVIINIKEVTVNNGVIKYTLEI